tara:strand:- start:313 stop:573 length:261 start_codon:yes stop_codon:yes gene_type:complete
MNECPICFENKESYYKMSDKGCLNYKRICYDCIEKLDCDECPYCKKIHHRRISTFYKFIFKILYTMTISVPIAVDEMNPRLTCTIC